MEMKFVYHSPISLLLSSEYIVNNVLSMQQSKTNNLDSFIMSSHCNFVVIAAACIEAHLNWYYFFDQDIDVDKYGKKEKYMPTDKKINLSPLLDETKKSVRAIYKLRNGVMHPKYQPRDATTQFPYDSNIMLFSFKTLVSVCTELLEKCPDTLNGRLSVSENQIKRSIEVASLEVEWENINNVGWAEIVNSDRVGLPMISVFDVPKKQ